MNSTTTVNPNRLGGLRSVADLILTVDRDGIGDFVLAERYEEWLATDAGEVRQRFDEWYEKFCNKVNPLIPLEDLDDPIDVIEELLRASRLSAFEQGARWGFQMILELVKSADAAK